MDKGELTEFKFVVRSADAIDGSVKELADEAGRCLWPGSAVLLRTWNPVLWAEYHGEPAGLLVHTPVSDTGLVWLDLIYVRPDFRNCGICLALLKHLLRFAAERGATTVGCSINAENNPMIRAVQSLGFLFEQDEGTSLLASVRINS